MTISDWILIAYIAGGIIVVALVTSIVILVLNRRNLKKRTMTWLELTPPASVARTPEATEQLFSVIHGMYAARRLKDKVLRRSPVFSFEIVSTKQDGIRYLVQVERALCGGIQKTIAAYVPDAKVKEIEAPDEQSSEIGEFRQTGHYVLPLTLTLAVEQHDPLGYVTNAMTKLQDDERVTMQLIVAPVKLREASKLAHKILGNEDILQAVGSKHFLLLDRMSAAANSVLAGAADLTGEVYHGTTSGSYRTKSNDREATLKEQVTKRQRPARTLSAFELELMESMHRKVTQPLFSVDLRIIASGSHAKDHLSALRSALDGFSVPLYQSLKMKSKLPILQRRRTLLARQRLPSLSRKRGLILSAAELAGLYHFPSSRISQTDNLVTSLSRTLPAPISLKQNSELDSIIGENSHHGLTTLIGLTELERQRHLYIIGGTGNGKTTMLQYQIVQDMQSGKGLAIIDPHGDMAETMLRHVPEERKDDVIYFNPDDLAYPIGLNLLELTPGLTGNELLREKDVITESVISVFRKIFSEEDTGGHRIEYVLRNAIQTALTIENATLFTVFDLLNDANYRKGIVKTLQDKNLINFWKNELGKAGDMQKVKMAAGITAKIGRFLFSASARQILEQPKSTIDFDEIINSGKILICNFSKGLLGEDTSELFGITVLAKLQLASLRRARIAQSERRSFYLYVDEFQNFATASFVQLLSEARKYKMFMIMAEQSTSQQKDQQMVSIILANVGTVICFRTGNPQDEALLLPLFAPYIEQSEISNLPAFNFYAKLSAIQPQEPLSGHTLLLIDDGSGDIAKQVISLSRKKFARKQKKAEVNPMPPQTVNNPKKSPTKDVKETAKPQTGVKIPGGR